MRNDLLDLLFSFVGVSSKPDAGDVKMTQT